MHTGLLPVSAVQKCQCSKAYIRILPRIWWSARAKELARRLDHYIEVVLRKEHNIRVKCFQPKSLQKFHTHSEIPDNNGNIVLSGFLEGDNTHLNYWGYQALLNDIVVPLMDAKVSASRK